MGVDMIDLRQGDCLELLKDIPDGSVDLILTDPPYGTTACKWDSVIPLDKMWNQIGRVAKKNAPVIVFGSEPFSSILRVSNLGAYKYDWLWDKKIPSGLKASIFSADVKAGKTVKRQSKCTSEVKICLLIPRSSTAT